MNMASSRVPAAPGFGVTASGGAALDHAVGNHSVGIHSVANQRGGIHSADIRPMITRHRLRRRRRRTAATLLTGASIALGAAAVRPSGASAHAHAAAPVTGTTPPEASTFDW